MSISKTTIARQYLNLLEQGNTQAIIELFSEKGQVDSPIYGVKSAKDFYTELTSDTSSSVLELKGIFEQKSNGTLAIYFTYHWTLANKEKVTFDVVDILEFDDDHKITHLKIIYDTVQTRKIMQKLN